MQTDLLYSILAAVSKRTNRQSFETWFKPISSASKDDTAVYLYVPSERVRDFIQNNYFDVLEESLDEIGLPDHTISFKVEERPVAKAAYAGAESPDSQSTVNASAQSPTRSNDISGYGYEVPLNPKYTFETFVVGSCNQFAHAAALAVVDMPSKTYNPLFLYGGVGLGKTHLMHAIGQAIKQRNNHLKLKYISSEKFMNELINAIRYDMTSTFRERYRNIDVLLMDDIQFIAGKERTQEEFFHTFNALHESQKQIVISSDCQPKEIPTLEERLHSRFEWGLIADFQPPDLETKVAILKKKAEIERVNLDDDVALYIASKIKSNIRELEGSLVRLVAYSSLKGLKIDKELAQQILNFAEEEAEGLSIDTIQRVVASHYGIKVADLKAKNNSRSVAVPRQVAMYLCKTLTKSSLPEIGRQFGGKHHTTVLHSINKISRLCQADSDFHKVINRLIIDMR